MKKFFLTIVLAFLFLFKSFADEGMWLPLLLGQQVYNDMVKKGLKLSKEQLYSMNKASLKDAIVIFGGGCTGEMVSPEGLLFTNHHCGYNVIAAASTVENNYLANGFYARNKSEEIPAQGLSVRFLLRIEDVTNQVLDSLKNLSGVDRTKRQTAVVANISNRFSNSEKNIEAVVSPLFKGNQYMVFVYQRFTDVRLVGTPPESVGKFGGDTDNWEWPRHTGDFSIFRVYMSKDGQPATYESTNVPMKPKWFLPISLKGVNEGDYAMIYGYPGGTNRYESSYGIKMSTDINNPTLVNLRDMRLKYMFEEMKNDPAVKLQLSSPYASIANYWKFYDGETKQLLKYDVYGQKQKQEEAFLAWAKGKPEYENIFSEWSKAYDAWKPYALNRMYMNEGILGSPLVSFAGTLLQLENALVNQNASADDAKRAIEAADKRRKSFLEEENKASDQNILGSSLMMYYQNVPEEQHPTGFYPALRNAYGKLDEESTFRKYAAEVFKNTIIFDDEKWNAFVKNPDANTLQQDLAFNVASTFIKNYNTKYAPYYSQFITANNELGRMYLKGVMEMDPKKVMYPDATFTMRVSYGSVEPYRPKDAVRYDYVTTAKGILEKYIPGDYEFDLPQKEIELLKKKDFGQYIDKKRNDLVINFITNNDITGGNSGSPVINGNGELIGLAFDGNYEALSHKLAFDKEFNRTICVDIRYVLWCIDKLGGAPHLLKELKLVK